MEKIYFTEGQTVWYVKEDKVFEGIVDYIDNRSILIDYPVVCMFGTGVVRFTHDGRFTLNGDIKLFQNEPEKITTIKTIPNKQVVKNLSIEEVYSKVKTPEFKFKAIDKNGRVHGYTHLPKLLNNMWGMNEGRCYYLGEVDQKIAEKCWDYSLIEIH